VLILLYLCVAPAAFESAIVSELPAEVRDLGGPPLELMVSDVQSLAHGDVASHVTEATEAAAIRLRQMERRWLLGLGASCLLVGGLGAGWAFRRIELRSPAIHRVERLARALLFLGSLVAVVTTLGIVLSLLFEALRFFGKVPWTEFLFGMEWSPQTAMRADQVGSSGSFGAVPLFAGTLLISGIAMAVATPIGLLSAFYMAEYAKPEVRNILKPMLEILAGIPTVVYGFFAALTVAPALRGWGENLGLDVASESALAAGLVMGVMIIPFVSSISDDVITAVPNGLRHASLGLGATKSETICRVVFPAALPGIVGGVLLAISRAIGETMIVTMAAGLSANLTANPLEAVTTVTVQIVTLLVGDQEFDSAKTLAAFALGLVLFAVTLVFNIIALTVVRKYREQYE
ncbi:MAG: phosphate ABC transporter permease subunit PstC, partial [Thermoanaerobaculia bacterium]|nr:phosphate ABC transporter permease subunit PstC [Thermoanaerobaculia bacterium]